MKLRNYKIAIILLSILFNINLHATATNSVKEVYVLDNRIDLSKVASLNTAVRFLIRVVPKSGVPSGLATPTYSFDPARNEIPQNSISKTNTTLLEINPRKMPRFFTQDLKEIFFDVNTPGQFMDREGELIEPSGIGKSSRLFLPVQKKNLFPPIGDIGKEDIFANSRDARNGFFVDIPGFPNLKVANFITTEFPTKVKTVGYFLFVDDGNNPFILFLTDINSLKLRTGLVAEFSRSLGQKILELANLCNNGSKEAICDKTLSQKEFKAKLELTIKQIPGFSNAKITDFFTTNFELLK